MSEDHDKATQFALTLGDTLSDSTVATVIGAEFPSLSNVARTDELFRAGYVSGSHDTYLQIQPRCAEMGRVLKNMYLMLQKMIPAQDNLEHLNDLIALRCEIAGYLVSESESILLAARLKLARMSGVPQEYVDGTVLISDIPPDALQEIGRIMAKANPRSWSIFALSNGEQGKNGNLTYEEMQHNCHNGRQYTMPDKSAFPEQLKRFGAGQVRHVRKMYRDVQASMQRYQDIHESDAKVVTDSVLQRAGQKG
jgi:hypothetical protein